MITDSLNDLRRRILDYELTDRTSPPPFTREEIKAALEELGVAQAAAPAPKRKTSTKKVDLTDLL